MIFADRFQSHLNYVTTSPLHFYILILRRFTNILKVSRRNQDLLLRWCILLNVSKLEKLLEKLMQPQKEKIKRTVDEVVEQLVIWNHTTLLPIKAKWERSFFLWFEQIECNEKTLLHFCLENKEHMWLRVVSFLRCVLHGYAGLRAFKSLQPVLQMKPTGTWTAIPSLLFSAKLG